MGDKWRGRAALIMSLGLMAGSSAWGADENAVVRRAAELLEEIAASPDSGIPAAVLREAAGIMVVPHIVETQLGIGRKHGDGVYLPRAEDGRWGAPQLVRLTNLTAGAEVGYKIKDLVIVYQTRKAAEGDTSKLAIGANAELIGRHPFRRSADPRKFHESKWYGYDSSHKDAHTYTRSWGHLLGIRVEGERQTRTEPEAPSPATAASPGLRPDANSAQVRAEVAPASRAEPMVSPAPETPEAARLKVVLATLTDRPAAEVATRAATDAKVQRARNVEPIAEAASPPRR